MPICSHNRCYRRLKRANDSQHNKDVVNNTVVEDFHRKVIHGFAWEAVTKLLVQVFSWVSTILVARLLVPDDYGLVLISGLFTGLFGMISGFGIASAVVQRDALNTEDVSTVFWLSIFLGVTVYLLLFMLSGPISLFYGEPELKNILRVAGLMVVLSAANAVPHALVMRQLKFKFSALVDMASKLILVITTLSLAYSGYGYWSLIVSTVAAEAFLLVVYFLALENKPAAVFNFTKVKDVFGYGSKILFSRLLMWWNLSSAAGISSLFFDKVVSGHLQMASTLATIPLKKIGEIFDKIAFPAIAAIKREPEQAAKVFLQIHKYLMMITVPMFVGIAIIAEQLVTVFLGEKWLEIVLPLQILCIICIFRISSQLIPRVLEGMGDAGASAKFQLFTGIIAPLGMLTGVYGGLVGILIGWLMTLPLIYIFLLRLVKKSLNVSFAAVLSTMFVPLLASALMVAIGYGLEVSLPGLSHSLLMVVKILSCATMFFTFYAAFQRQNIKEIVQYLRNMKSNG